MKTPYSTVKRFLLPILALLVIAPIVYIKQHVSQQMDTIQTGGSEQARTLGRLLNISDVLVDEQANVSMRLLKERTSALGAPTVNGSITVNGKLLPNLFFGQTSLTNNFKLVDSVTSLAGGTATLFVKSGNDFVRVTTNVQLANGTRAIGTSLDPSGKAILAMRAGQEFHGVVDILGEPYITRYDPLFDKNGNVVGAYYVGYKVDMKVLREAVQNTRYLKTGFALLIDSTNKTRFLSSHISSNKAEILIHEQPEGWTFIRETVPNWGFTIIVAYPTSEASAIALASSWFLIIAGSLLSLLLIALIVRQMRHLIVNPIGADPALAIGLVNSIAAGNLEEDGLTAKSGTLMANVINMRQKLSEMVATLQKNADRMSLSASVFAHANDGIFIADTEMCIIEVNQSFSSITGYAHQTALGCTPESLGFVSNDTDFFHKLKNDPKLAEGWRGEAWNSRNNGEKYAVWLDIFIVRDDAQHICNYVGLFSDITEQKQAETSLRESESRFRSMIEAIPDAIFFKDGEGRWLTVNESAKRLYHLHDIPWQGKTEQELAALHPEFHSTHQTCLVGDETTWQAGEMRVFPETSITKDRQRLDLEVRKVPIYDEQGQRHSLVTIGRNVTEQKQAEVDLRVAAIAFESQEGMMVTDANKIILRVNHAFTTITGFSAEEAIGQTPSMLTSGRQDKHFYAAMWKVLNDTGVWEGEIWNRRRNGEIYPEYLAITAVKDADGIVTNYVATLTDITLRKEAEERIQDLAFYDPLTHLPNRRLLLDRLSHAMASSARNNRDGALLFLDLDHFKSLNDTLGHDMGDLLLQQVAERLISCVREGDTVARLGGDEFVVLLEDLSELSLEAAAQTETIGEKIVAVLNQPYQLGSHEHQTTSSIGVALFSDHNQSLEDLLKHADIAMYQAKKLGRNRLSFFDPYMQDAINTRVDMEHELRKALDQQQFQLHYQIQVDSTGLALGAEALIRWNHPERGMISPFHFIPLAEDTGLILPIGQWVLETACAQIKQWQSQKIMRKLVLSVNVSAKQFLQLDFAKQVQEVVQRHGIDPNRLKLELTESMLLDKIDHIIATMNALKMIGIRFSLDDFGTGYSSLQYLKKLPLNQLKIDQSFVRDIATDQSDKAIVLTIITMAHSLGLGVIAEGVETEEQRQFLLENKCMHYQGYLFSKPVAIDEFEALLRKS